MKTLSEAHKKSFTRTMMRWNRSNTREMPWKGEKDPYKVWLSEIILQQTRVEQGRPYYERFIEKYPRVQKLAAASDEAVFRLWQGLGYYNRCKNMLAAARHIASGGGVFPDSYAEILALPGVGAYTAAAIASFAFGLPHAVVDGNVQRVLARYFGIACEVNSLVGKKTFAELAEQVLDKKDPGAFNQAIMDFGATVCTPQQPRCGDCPFRADCYAATHGLTASFPVKTPKAPPRQRYFTYLVLRYDDQVYLHKRGKGDIWQNLHEFLLREGKTDAAQDAAFLATLSVSGTPADGPVTDPFRQQLTHQIIFTTFREYLLKEPARSLETQGFFPVKITQLNRFAFPRTIVRYLEIKGWTK